MVIGQKGAGVEAMKAAISKVAGKKEVNINVIEIKTPDLDAQLVAESIAQQLDQRIVCRRAMKQAIARCQKAGVKGVKVWIYKGEILGKVNLTKNVEGGKN